MVALKLNGLVIKKLLLILFFFAISAIELFAFQSSREAEVRELLIEQRSKFYAEKDEQEISTDADTAQTNFWTKSWILNITGNQASYRNWSQGGVNTIAITGSTLGRLRYTGKYLSNSIRVNLQLGQTWLDGDDSRKTADLINIRNKVDYFLGTDKVSAFVELDLRTQFVKGFDDNNEEVVSAFWAPGYLTESIGFSYQPEDWASGQVGLGLRQTFVRVDSLDQFYGLDEDEDIRSEGGLTVAINLDKDFAETFNYSAEITTFTNLFLPIRRTDLIFRNELTGKLNSFLSTIIQFEIMYDDDVSNKLQMRQAISVGLNIELL